MSGTLASPSVPRSGVADAASRALMRHSKIKGELDESTYNVRHDGVGSNILLPT
jgi:hypothetical protein